MMGPMAAPMMDKDKPEPIVRVSWPKEARDGGIKVTGDPGELGPGKRVRLVIEGSATGFSMQDWGCDISLKGKTIRIEALGGDGAEPMTDVLGKKQRTRGRRLAGLYDDESGRG